MSLPLIRIISKRCFNNCKVYLKPIQPGFTSYSSEKKNLAHGLTPEEEEDRKRNSDEINLQHEKGDKTNVKPNLKPSLTKAISHQINIPVNPIYTSKPDKLSKQQREIKKNDRTVSCNLEPSQESIKQHGKYSRQAVRQNVEGYVFTRYIDYVKNYDKLLEKKFPQAARVYNIFFDGIKEFLNDLKMYLKIWRIVNMSTKGLEALTRKEIELFMQMPRDMLKVAPTLLISALPFVGYAIFPVAYAKPRVFLSQHFWTIQQKNEFQLENLKDRLLFNKPVFRYLQSKLKTNKGNILYPEWSSILGKIGSGQHPTAEQIISIRELFTDAPYSFISLPSSHVKNLCYNHGISARFLRRNRLLEHAYLIHHMDRAIKREGDVHNMQPNALRKSCYLRGLNPSNLTNEQMIDWLQQWVKVSLALEEDHIGLFVHLPVLMTYNNPNNWKLIY